MPIEVIAALWIDQVQINVEIYKQGWKDLELPKGHGDMLEALVKTHLSEKVSRTANLLNEHEGDIVKGKG